MEICEKDPYVGMRVYGHYIRKHHFQFATKKGTSTSPILAHSS
jgi:hypothetical protein